jgi:hypothetical protein
MPFKNRFDAERKVVASIAHSVLDDRSVQRGESQAQDRGSLQFTGLGLEEAFGAWPRRRKILARSPSGGTVAHPSPNHDLVCPSGRPSKRCSARGIERGLE